MEDTIHLTINGKEMEARKGATILEAARLNNIPVPTLCFHENLLPIGSCRLCIVEVEGYDLPVASCTTPVVEGMAVTTHSEKLFRMRQDYLKFLLIHHPLDCPICDAGGECRLQDLVYEHTIEKVDLAATRQERQPAYFSTPLMRYFEKRCVLCLRCIHACREVSGRKVLDLSQKGIEARMSVVDPADCISCGECLSVCPVGSITEHLSPMKSRIWQVERVKTTCPQCGFGCTIHLDVYRGRFATDLVTFPDDMPNKGSLCVLGRFGYDLVNHEAKLTTSMVKNGGVGKTAALSEAVDRAYEGLTKIDKEGKGIGFIVSSRATNEEIFMVREIASRFKKGLLATPAFYHTGKVFGLYKEMGFPRAYQYDDVKGADLVIVAGANLLSNNHVLGNRVRDAYKVKGARVIVIDPTPTALTRIADVHLKVNPGADAQLFNGLSRRIIAEEGYAKGVQTREGFEELRTAVQSCEWEASAKEAGVDLRLLQKAYGLMKKAAKVTVILGSGISSREDSLRALLNLSLLGGWQVMAVSQASNGTGASALLDGAVAPDQVLNDGDVKGLFIYEDDPFLYLNHDGVKKALSGKEFLFVADAFPTMASEPAHLVVPTGTFAQKEGTRFAEDGHIRYVNRAMGGADGFLFLRDLLVRLGGTSYRNSSEVTKKLRESGIISTDPDGTERLNGHQGAPRFRSLAAKPVTPSSDSFTLILRDIFRNHHIADKEAFSKGIARVYEGTGYPISEDKLFMSPEDAEKLDVKAGATVLVTSKAGSMEKGVALKQGLKSGVLEYVVFRERETALSLSEEPAKAISVTVRKV